jgi:filamentous hemagglutinin
MTNSTPTIHTASAHDIVHPSRLRRHIAVITLIAYIGQPIAATAEIIADQAAAANNRPVVDTTANGLPLVQIAAPGAAGVSHNQYTQFNVDPAGLILNNSQSTVITQQAGYVSANPNLVNSAARVILNEITSTHRSQLNGYTEVAGQQAEVIIANPNGITCNGCGFINTSRGVLTTGMPVMGASGSLDAFRVTGGDIQIGTGGMNGSNLDQLDLIARSVKVNGELWASNLNVITGANLADYNTLGVQVIQGTGAKPTVGIDVALLGGMYANKITLIGTEAGVGVNSLGNLSAQAGDFTLDNQGQITLGGSTTASGNLTIAGNTSVTNSGTLYSQQTAQLTSTGDLTNSGLLSAQGNLTLNAANLDSTGALGAGIDLNGNATQNGNLTIAIQNQTVASGTNISGGNMSVTATDINLANSNTNARSGINLDATVGNIDLTGAQTQSVLGDIALNATGSITNNQGSLYGAMIASTSAGFSNTSGSIYASGNLNINSSTSLNSSGQLLARGDLILNASSLNSTGTLGSGIDANGNATQNGSIHITTQNQAVAAGDNVAGGSMSIAATDINLANSNTNARSGINLDATAGSINLTSAQTQSVVGDIVLNAAGSINNNQGGLYGVAITSTSAGFSNTSGSVYASGNLNINSSSSLTNSGKLLAQRDLTLNASNLNSTGILGAGIDVNGNATQNGNLTIITQNQTIATGQNIAGGSMSIAATDINLANSDTNVGSGINLNAAAGNINLTSAQTQSVIGSIILNATGTVTNNAGQLFGAQVSSNAASFSNINGALGALGNISLTANSIDNSNGQIGNALNGAGNITLTATGNLTNTGGQIGSDQDLIISANTIAGNGQVIAGRDSGISLQGNYTNAAGNVLKANCNLTFGITGNFINQTALEAVGTLSVSAANITNQTGAIINANLSNLSATNTLANQGLLNATSQLTATANTVSNTGSIIGGNVSLTGTQLIENVGTTAFIGASNTTGLLELLAPTIQNRDDTTSTDTMAQTMIYGRGQVILAGAKNVLGQYTNAVQVLNQSGLIQSEGNMSVYANTLTNTRRALQMSNAFNSAGGTVSGTGYWTPGSTVPGGAYINMNIGGGINSSYLYTSYTGTTLQNSVASISPAALVISGGNFNPYVTTLQNYWSKVSATGNISLTGVTLDQDSWRGATAYTQRATYFGDWWYRNYTGYIWTFSCYGNWFQLTNCGNAWGPQVVDTPLAGYDSSFTANTITATGATINNIAGTSATTPLGAQSLSSQPSVLTLPGGQAAQPSALTLLGGQTAQPASLTLPQGGLYTTNTAPQAQYLVETNPAFADRSQWLSSDWYFTHANIDPGIIQKRLGDGFYEQQLVRNELMSLTGRQLLGNYADEQTQFMEMMTSGAKLSMSLKLSSGIGLTADQVAKLTDNVIIMETREVQGQQVLVPIVYLAHISEGELLASGPLIAANNIILDGTKGFTNSGTIRAGNTLSISGRSADNRGGNLQSGGLMLLNTEGDIDFTSANIKAGSLALKTGGNLLLNTGARTVNMNGLAGGGSINRSSTMLGRIASMDIDGNALIQTGGNFELNGAQFKVGGDLVTDILGNWQIGTRQTRETTTATAPGVQAFADYIQHIGSVVQIGGKSNINIGKDFLAQGAQINLQGGGGINASGNIELKAVKNSFRSDSTGVSKNHYGRNQSYDETLVGTNLQSGQGLTISSGKDITLSSSTLNVTQGNATLAAAGNVNIKADSERHESSIEDSGSSRGLATTTTRTSRTSSNETLAVGSGLSADNINIQAGKQQIGSRQGNINVIGSSIAGTNDVSLEAANDINILAATNSYSQSNYSHTSTSGLLFNGGPSITLGKREQTNRFDASDTVQSQNRSLVGSTSGNLNLKAGGNALVSGSDIIAANNIDLSAQNVTINSGLDQNTTTQSQDNKQSGLTVAVTSNVTDAVQTVQQMKRASEHSKDKRIKALGATSAALNVANVVSSGPNIGVSATLGSGQSHSESTQQTTLSSGSTLNAGGNINIRAIRSNSLAPKGGEGWGEGVNATEGNITIQGSDIQAGNNVTLNAENKINLLAAQNTASQTSHNTSSSSGAGVGATFGSSGTAIGFTANASRGRGNADGSDLNHTNTQVNAGNKLTLKSGGDTNLKGAVANGNQIVADIGGNLNIQSLQDTSTYSSKQTNAGGSVTVGAGVSGSVNYGNINANSDYASVNQQSGINAGNGGFQIAVRGNTDLKGAVISSSDQAIQDNKNTLVTATLTTSDIANHAEASAEAGGVSLSSDMVTEGKYGVTKGVVANTMSNADESGSSAGQTRSAVSAGAVVITDEAKQKERTGKSGQETVATLNRDTATTHTAAQKQDVGAMQQTVEAERAIKVEAFKQVTVATDEAYKTMFTKEHALLEVTKNPDGTLKAKEVNGTDNLQKGADGKVHLSTNGIFNSTGAATKYTEQHATDPGTQYLIAFPEANSLVAELFVAGYQKFLESDALGLTNSTTQVVGIMNQYGQSGLELNGHSRGSLTIGNAMDSMARHENAKGSLSGTRINFFGPAMNVNNADATLSTLQNRPSMPAAQQSNATLHYMCHVADPVCGIIGWNDATGGTVPMGSGTVAGWSAEDGAGGSMRVGGSSPVWERIRAATGQENTSHNLYFVNQMNLQPNLAPEVRRNLINDFWGAGIPTLQPAKK